jgi:hypothetical protein
MAVPLGPGVSRVVVSVCLAFTAGVTSAHTTGVMPRVRALDPALRELVDEGARRSTTFRGIVTRIDASDGIVYVETGTCPVGALRACLVLAVREAGHTRYLSIHVTGRRQRRDDDIAMIGHELQHANELLTAAWVRNSADAYALFLRIGSPASIRSFETGEAQRVGALIARELASGYRTQ